MNSHAMVYDWVTTRNTAQGSPLPPGQASSGGPLHLVHLQVPQVWRALPVPGSFMIYKLSGWAPKKPRKFWEDPAQPAFPGNPHLIPAALPFQVWACFRAVQMKQYAVKDTHKGNRFMNTSNEKMNTRIRTVVSSGEKDGAATEEGPTGV